MAEHDELVSEMLALEQLGTQERQKLAKKRRMQQLKKWSQREREWIANEKQLQKRLVNIMIEENNGLNLKQYTTYDSAQRTKRRIPDHSGALSVNNNNHISDETESTRETNDSVGINGVPNGIAKGPTKTAVFTSETNDSTSYLTKNLKPNGKVHFDSGVMLLEAAARQDYNEVKRLLQLGVSPDSINHDGLTALHQCCIDANESIMELLLEFGADVDARDTEQWTPLHAACTCGHLNLVKILVESHADLLAVNGDGNMPFDICEDDETLDFIENQMIKQGITQEQIDLKRQSNELRMYDDLKVQILQGELNSSNINDQIAERGVTRLHIAAANNYLSVVKLLLEQPNIDVNICDSDLWQPIHGAACWGTEQHIKVIEALVEAGASLESKNINDENVFDLCGNLELLGRLNKLRDDLENQQKQSDPDRLRRTQSRTNSRVHSIRRTSVRDKSQISRREAREEALLRVESDTSITPTPKLENSQSNGHSVTEPAGATPLDEKNRSDIDNAPSDSDKQLPVTLTSESKRSQNGGRSTSSTGNSEDSGARPKESDILSSPTIKSDPAQCDNKSATSINAERNKSTVSSPVTSTSQATLRENKNAILLNVEHNNSIDRDDSQNVENDTSSNCDVYQQAAMAKHKQSTTIHVQFNPTNYTLSNLKKHRSDLRMRCLSNSCVSNEQMTALVSQSSVYSSLPFNSITQKPPELVETSDEDRVNVDQIASDVNRQHISLDQNSHSDIHEGYRIGHGDNRVGTLIRSQSPNRSFRRYYGQPSENMGSDEKRIHRHECCSLM